MTVTIHPRPAAQLSLEDIAAWADIPVSVAVDLDPDLQLDNLIRLQTPGAKALLGPAMTVSCAPPDFGAVVLALDHVQKGDVVVIAAGGNLDTAVIGEILGGHLRDYGCAGLIVDGVVRDIEILGSFEDFPVYARGVNPRGPTSATGGTLNAPVTISGRPVATGDLILGDRDGLIALPPAQATARLADAKGKVAREADWIEGLRSGKTAREVFGL